MGEYESNRPEHSGLFQAVSSQSKNLESIDKVSIVLS
jgi:hypothetical protein